MNKNISWGHLTLRCEFQFSHAEKLCPVFLCHFPPWRVDICVTPKHVYCCTRAGDPGQDFLSRPRESPSLSRQVLLGAELGHDPWLQSGGNACAEPGATSQLQLCQGLVTNILHLENEAFATGISFVERSSVQEKSSSIGCVDDGQGTMGKPKGHKYLFLPFSSAHLCSGMKWGLEESKNDE